jgi:bacillithiol system protein YtxJ
VISLLGNSLLRETRESGTLKIMVVQLRQDRDLEQLLEQSKTNPVLIFKHSTQCPISSHAYEEFTEFAEAAEDLICALVLVIENRNVSNTIAERLNVPHESPQAIVVKDGHAAWHASHWSITADSLNEALRSNVRSGYPSTPRDVSVDQT